MIIQLPFYIQKYIIKILCKFIDRNNRLLDVIGIGMDVIYYRVNEKEIKQLMIRMALVSHDWFEALSNNLSVSVDFNYKDYDDNWSIIKQNNVKALKLHYTHDKNQVYSITGGKLTEIPMEIVNERIEKLTKSSNGLFKKLKFRNIEARSTPTKNVLPIINSLYNCNWGSNHGGKDLHVYEFILTQSTTLEDIKTLEKKVKGIISIKIDSCTDKEIILKSFEICHKKLILVELAQIFAYKFSLCDILVIEGNHNYLSNVRQLNMIGPNTTVKECVLLFKYAHKLEHFRINICYSKLLNYVLTDKELIENPLQGCYCNSLTEMEASDDPMSEFNENWPILKQLVNNHKTLKTLAINHDCTFGNQIDLDILPDSFVKEIVSLVSPCESLRNFTFMNAITSQVFKELIKQNKTITNFQTFSIDGKCDFESTTKDFNQIIQENPQIQSFVFAKQINKFVGATVEHEIKKLIHYEKE